MGRPRTTGNVPGDLAALVQEASRALVAVAVTDRWEAVRPEFARLLADGNEAKLKLAQQRIARTRDQLIGATGGSLESARASLEAQWAMWLTALLDQDRGAQADLRAMVEQIQAAPPGGMEPTGGGAAADTPGTQLSPHRGMLTRAPAHEGVMLPGSNRPGPGGDVVRPGFADSPLVPSVLVPGGTLATTAAPHRARATGTPVRLADPPPLLAGRETLLATLDTRLAGGADSGPRIVVLSGPAGVGKTSVALAYAHHQKHEVAVAWQLAAADPIVLAAGFGELAAQLEAGDLADDCDSVAVVHRVLAELSSDWLLIFDDAPDWASVQAFLPPAGSGQVLITSQNHAWPSGQGIDVPVLDLQAAAGLLANRTGEPDRQSAQELAAELQGLPLALEQAASCQRATGDSVASYLASFRPQRAHLLVCGEPTWYRGVAATTWELAFTRLEQSAPSAAGLLRLLAFCAPGDIPLHLLLQPRPGMAKDLPRPVVKVLKRLLEDQRAAGEAEAALRRYSLIGLGAGEAVTVHPLVQTVTADQMPVDLADAWRQAAAAVIEAAIPQVPDRPDTWLEFAALVSHARLALPADSDAMARIADYLGFSGSYVAARDLWREVAKTRIHALGPDHPDALHSRASVAEWTGRCGDAAGARNQYTALLPVREEVHGSDHPDTLTEHANRAYWTGKAGDPAGARDQYAALLPIRERLDGPEHPDTLDTRAELARWTGEAGDPARARDQYAGLLSLRERLDGPDNRHTLDTRSELARWTGEAGDAAGARDQYATVLPIRERIYGPDHPGTRADRVGLANWAAAASDPAQARDKYEALLPIRERVYGPDHPDTLNVRSQLARWTGVAGDAAGARDQYASLLPRRERVHGAGHPATLSARASLAHWIGEAGDAAGASDRYAALLPVLERVLGPEHLDTLSARFQLARRTGEAGDASAARDLYAALLPVYDMVYGPEHPDTLSARFQLANWTGHAGDAAKARDQFAALASLHEEVSGTEHPDTLDTCANLAYWTGEAGDAAGALGQFETLLPVRERVFGPQHPTTLIDRANLAHLTGLAGDPRRARDLCAALLPVIQRVYGSQHPATRAVQDNLTYWDSEARSGVRKGP
jgi:Tetratricopeptide repeat